MKYEVFLTHLDVLRMGAPHPFLSFNGCGRTRHTRKSCAPENQTTVCDLGNLCSLKMNLNSKENHIPLDYILHTSFINFSHLYRKKF